MPLTRHTTLWCVLIGPSLASSFVVSSLLGGSHVHRNVAQQFFRPDGRQRSGLPSLRMGGGFGGAGAGGRAAVEAPGSAEAKTALETSGGDLNKATSMVFHRRLERMQAKDEALADMLRQLSAAGKTGPTAAAENEAVHEALVSATWDAVAVMNALPKGRKTSADERDEKRIAKRLKAIADAARLPPRVGAEEKDLAAPPFNGKILDIGCGDGMLVPHLLDNAVGKKKPKSRKTGSKKAKADGAGAQQLQQKAGMSAPPSGPTAAVVREADVTGVDLSEVMISSAKQKYPEARWLTGNAHALASLLGVDRPEPLFSSVVFNGSLQFFRDPPDALAKASEWLMDGGHIVVSHVQGSDFVRDECRKNPRVAPSPMPGGEGMAEWASRAGCTLLEGPDDLSQRDFLLQVMRKL